MAVAGQMRHVRTVPAIAAEALQLIWMRSDDHDMRAHVKLLFRLAGPVRDPGTRIHVGNAKPIDVLRPASKTVQLLWASVVSAAKRPNRIGFLLSSLPFLDWG
jgi:hypothetical protein